MKTDRFLIAIVAGIGVLVVAALALALVKPAPTYGPDDTAAGVARNYFLALQKGDYARAYGYLSPSLLHYPQSLETFVSDVRHYGQRLEAESVSLEIVGAQTTGSLTQVTMRETRFSGGGLFDSNEYTNTFQVELRQQQGAWKITRSDSYWVWCWTNASRCPAPR